MSATLRQTAPSPRQDELPFELGFREWHSPRSVGEVIGMSEGFVEKLFDEGRQLSGHVHNAGRGVRETKRIPRVWVAAYLMRTARYDLDTLVQAITAGFRRLSTPLLRRIVAAAEAEIDRREGRPAA